MAGLRLDLGRIDKDLTSDLTAQLTNKMEGSTIQDQQHHELDPLSDGYSPDDHLSPVEKLEKYFQSEESYEREFAVRSMVDAGYYVDSYTDFELILEIVNAMASDHEPNIRIGILCTVSSLLERNTGFRENINCDTSFGQENEDRLYEIPVKMLNDFNQQVRRMSHNTIVLLLEEPKSSSLDSLVAQLCPMIQKCLGKEENYDLRMDTVMLISRCAMYFGQSVCINELIPLLPSLASDSMFHVRKSFAICCKDLCAAVGLQCTETNILPYFLQLCQDEVWGVRKACADVFMDVSLSCSLATRKEKLTPIFLFLLKDDSRWVRKAAYQCLGPFISTFCTPSSHDETESIDPLSETELFETSLLGGNTSEDTLGNNTSGNSSGNTTTCSMPSTGSATTCSMPTTNSSPDVTFNDPIDKTPSKGANNNIASKGTHIVSPLMIFQTPPQPTGPLATPTEDTQYNSFQFWRSPVSNIIFEDSETLGKTEQKEGGVDSTQNDKIKLDLFGGVVDELTSSNEEGEEETESDDGLADIKDELLAESEVGGDNNNDVFTEEKFVDVGKLKLIESPLGMTLPNGLPKVRVFIQNTTGQVHEEDTTPSTSGCGFQPHSTPFNRLDHSLPMEMTLIDNTTGHIISTEQDTVPDELIDMYLCMVDPVKSQCIDADLPLCCAFSFPAVLHTLGPDHWPLLKPTFDTLSGDMQWKIRRILAHSIHEVARILGQERTVADLLTVVDEYSTKDLDDIKMGILVHLTEFFEMLPSDVRKEYFPSILNGILDIENEKNWRYRDSLAEQLSQLCGLFDCSFIEEHIVPVAIKLGHDKIAQIRESASNLIGVLLQKFNRSRPSSCPPILKELRESYATSHRWLLRLMYVKQCEMFLQKRLVSCSLFANECLPSLLSLSSDCVPNVRLSVGRLLNCTISNIDFFSSNYSLSNSINKTLSSLRTDSDTDVRYFSGSTDTAYRPRPHDHTPNNNRVYNEGETENKLDIGKAASLLYLS